MKLWAILILVIIYKTIAFLIDCHKWRKKQTQDARLFNARYGHVSDLNMADNMHAIFGTRYDPWWSSYKTNGYITQEECLKWMEWNHKNLK